MIQFNTRLGHYVVTVCTVIEQDTYIGINTIIAQFKPSINELLVCIFLEKNGVLSNI